MLDHRHDREEGHQQRGEGQGVLEGPADLMFVSDAVEAGDQHDDQQADQADLGHMQPQADDQDQGSKPLYPQRDALGLGACGIVLGGIGSQYLAHCFRHQRAVAEQAQLLQQHAGQQAGTQHRYRHGRHLEEEVSEVPAHLVADQQVLRLAHQRAHATQGGTHCAVHQQAAQERAELVQVVTV
ncbi:hypothetical protein D9M73_208740 [compost metagenome]